MNAYEFNKIAGAALTAALFVFGARELIHITSASHAPAKPGYTLPAPSASPAAGGAAVAAFNPAGVVSLVAKASADAGKEVFKACVQCHRTEKGAPSPQGPNLHGAVGREVGKAAGFGFSPAMAGKGGTWTYEALAAYLYDPRGNIPGNRMAFAGVKDERDLADLLAFMRTQADTPAPLPK
jgi:cytochrome c